jgi:hypothetical protein
MNREDIISMAKEARFYINDNEAYSPSNQEDFELTEHLERFAKLVEDRAYAKQLELPEPRLTGKFSITMGKFKCTGCTDLWDSSEQAKNHSCRDYQ